MAWGCIWRDKDLECACGNEPYDNGNHCPKCFAALQVMHLEELKEKLFGDKKDSNGSKLISTVHDSIVADCPDNEVLTVASLFDETFRDLPKLVTQAYGVEWNVPMLGEVQVGHNMLEMEEIKL